MHLSLIFQAFFFVAYQCLVLFLIGATKKYVKRITACHHRVTSSLSFDVDDDGTCHQLQRATHILILQGYCLVLSKFIFNFCVKAHEFSSRNARQSKYEPSQNKRLYLMFVWFNKLGNKPDHLSHFCSLSASMPASKADHQWKMPIFANDHHKALH